MLSKKTALLLVSTLVLLTMIAAQCGAAPTPQTIVEKVVETVVVEKEGQKVVETVVVEKTVEVTPVPEAGEEKVTLDTIIGTEPPTMDPSLGTDSQSIWMMRQMFMGLTAFDEKAEVIPSLATEWSASEDGLTWTYKMRNDVHWVHRDPTTGEFTDLGPVTAQDVEYGVKRTLDPATASDYAYVLYMLQGAEEFNTADPGAENFGELSDAVGVKALDEATVQFTLREPAGYFPAITGMWITFPQPQATIEQYGTNWTEAGLIVTNGPYTLEEWTHGAYIRLVKNPLWVNADQVQIEVIQGPLIQEASTAMAMYEANEIDMMVDNPGWGPPLPDMDRIKADSQLSQELFIAPRLCTYWFGFVNTKPPFDNVLVRKAFATAIDRQRIVVNITKGEQIPAHSFAPPGIFGNAADDLSIGDWMIQDDYADQLKQAQAWLAEAGYPEGEGIDMLLMYNTSEAHGQITQAVHAMWGEAFPKAKIRIENQEWRVYLRTLLPGSPDEEKPHAFRMGWCADYPDQNNFVHLNFHTQSGQNYPKYFNPEFDALVEEAAFEADPARRIELYRQAEEMLMNDQAIAPVYYYTFVRLHKPWLTNVVISPVTGDPVHQWEMDWEAKQAARGD